MERTKKLSVVEGELESEADRLMAEFALFTSGTRYLTLLHRSKDDGPATEYKRRVGWFITHNEADYRNALISLLGRQILSSRPFRLYTSLNARNISKAEKAFKMDMLTLDFDAGENKRSFWERLPEKWVSALMQPGSRSESMFMLDVDGEGDVTGPVLKWLAEHEVEIIKQYKTPNGWHIVTPAFNPTEFDVPNCEIKKDGLLLLSA